MRYLPALIFLLFFSSCVDSARFEVPQPEGINDEKRISKRLIGKYLKTTDSTILLITKNLITKTSSAYTKEALSKLDSIDKIKLDSLSNSKLDPLETNPKIDFKIKSDSIFYQIKITDTLFFLSEKFRLRKFKGFYFISELISPGSWNVTKLEKIKGGLVIGEITTKQELNELRAITEVYDSTTTFKPTKKQFKKLIQQNGFRTEEKFLKVE